MKLCYWQGLTGCGGQLLRKLLLLALPATVQAQFSFITNNGAITITGYQFGFTVTGTTNIPIMLEATPYLTDPAWTPLQNCTLTNGSLYFADPAWTNFASRFYRIRWP